MVGTIGCKMCRAAGWEGRGCALARVGQRRGSAGWRREKRDGQAYTLHCYKRKEALDGMPKRMEEGTIVGRADKLVTPGPCWSYSTISA